MRLTLVRIEWFRSVKQVLDLHIDPAITILIGANDHGKTNLLKAILALNRERPLSPEDQNWDCSESDSLRITHRFTLDEEEGEVVRVLGTEPITRASDTPDVQSDTAAVSPPESAKIPRAVPTQVDFVQVAGGAEPILTFDVDLPEPEFPGLRSYVLGRLPRVELFESVRQLTDVVTLSEVEDPSQEFMQGIFRYAAIWERRARLFQQNPATARELERASEAFTSRIRTEWHQGENLTFKFQHAGINGSQIEILIRDPSVANRFVRPSERSAGFSAFFEMSMRLLARTESHKAQSYIFLFDEPGTALHPSGQVNLQRVFERLAQDNQIVYATHSLFMISHNRPERSRVVSKGESGTRLDEKPYLRNWRAVRDSLGLILTGNFFIADTTLLVEGESDAMYIGL
jgi:predicted ATPase